MCEAIEAIDQRVARSITCFDAAVSHAKGGLLAALCFLWRYVVQRMCLRHDLAAAPSRVVSCPGHRFR
jgi:hypothetical protein